MNYQDEKSLSYEMAFGNIKFKNGDVWNIGQTINGIDSFIYIEGNWHYYSERMMREFEYDQEELFNLIYSDIINECGETLFMGNIFVHFAGS